MRSIQYRLRVQKPQGATFLFLLLLIIAFPGSGLASAQSPGFKGDFDRRPVEDDAALIERINQAIVQGERWLMQSQGKEGSFQNEERSARVGYTELALFALSSSGVALSPEQLAEKDREKAKTKKPSNGKAPAPNAAQDHAIDVTRAIHNALNFIRNNPRNETYALSLLLLSLDAISAPAWERAALARMSGDARARYSWPRRLSPADRSWMQQIVAELTLHRFKGCWSYTKNPGVGDISNTQFALLGLRAAANCGIFTDASIWGESLDYFLKYQDERGQPIQFPIPAGDPATGRNREIVTISAEQRSWGYSFAPGGFAKEPGKPAPPPKKKDKPVFGWSFGATGTHTSIGIASLQIIRDELDRARRSRKDTKAGELLLKERERIDRGIRDGLGWLAGHWNLEEDPGGGFPFYYLYSVERVGALLGDRFIAGHDWYREGAEILLRRQLKEGAWPSDMGEVNAFGAPDVCATSFALLFLRRATAPGVITPNLAGR